MVRLNSLLLLRKPAYDPAYRVTRERYIAKGAEYLFKDNPSCKVIKKFDGTSILRSRNCIRMALDGCTNRPFYRIVLAAGRSERDAEIEQLGTFDPMPNMFNEKLCSFNYERIKYHLAMGAHPSRPIRRLLGLSGFLPLDPTLPIFAEALRRRRKIENLIEEQKEKEESDENAD